MADNAPAPHSSPEEQFKAAFPPLAAALIDDLRTRLDLPADVLAYISRSIDYNVPHGKLTRGLAVVECTRGLHSASADSAQPFAGSAAHRAALVLGWCVEFLQAYFLVADDIMDGSVTRRGRPCFYRVDGVGMKAVNDALMLEAMVFRLLELRVRPLLGDRALSAIIREFLEITYTTEAGQLLDMAYSVEHAESHRDAIRWDAFTHATLERIYKYKTSHYSFYLSVALGMHVVGLTDPRLFERAREICLALGHYFQAQDDILDCFGDPAVTGKVGTDIQDCKCTWLVVEALVAGTPEQIATIKENYGKKDEEAVLQVKKTYQEIGIQKMFDEYEKQSFEKIKQMIANLDGTLPAAPFEFLLSKVYKRKK